ncbi:MAG: YbjN domain-containing protein, partial [Lachnospiraceae bacterium]|nr:YbjN domain-containing protein [Lachnospiraceae bacterium]
MSLTKVHFRQLLDELGIQHKVDSDGDYLVHLEKDNDCCYDVFLWFMIGENTVTIMGWSVNEIPSYKHEEALMFCNKFNEEHRIPNACIASNGANKGKLFCKYSLFTDIPLSDEYLKENFIRLGISTCWQ